MACLDAHTVTALFAGALSGAERDAIDQHVDGCADCRRWVAGAARDHVARAPESGETAAATEESAPVRSGPVALAPGARVGRYVVRDFLGAGAMGAVYAAHDPQLDREIALKVMRAGDEARAQRFVREAQAMARVSHPNVVPIYDAGQSESLVFIAMKRIDGPSLRRYLAESDASARERLRLLCDAGRGLAAAHAAGIVHRDFKPDNVLVASDGTAQVADFGLAAIAANAADSDEAAAPPVIAAGSVPPSDWQTTAGTILGTPAYLAPELRGGRRADAQSDQYSYAKTIAEVAGPALPRRVRRALERALAAEPAQRFASVDQLVARLEARAIVPWIAAGAVALAAVVWLVWPRGDDPAAACEVAAVERLAAVHSVPDRARLVAHLASLPRVHPADAARAQADVDRYARGWLAMRRDACRAGASGEQSAELRDLRMACLDERLDELTAVRLTLAALPAERAEAIGRVGSVLGDLQQCASPNSLRIRKTPDPVRTRALRARLAAGHVQLQQGDYAAAERAFDGVLADARAARIEIVEAEALIGRATVLGQTRRPGAIDGFHQVRAIAERLGDPALRADALNALLADAAIDRARASEIALLARLIETALAELPGPQARRRGILAANLANHYEDKQDFAAAQRSIDDAARLFRDELGATHPYTLMARETAARIQSTQGNQDRAIAISTELLAELRRTYGETHPLIAKYELSLGVWYGHAERTDDARRAFDRALAISERAYGPVHKHVADALRKIGYLELDRDPRAARAAFARAVAIFEQTGGTGPQIAPLLAGLGEAELGGGDPAAAVKTLERALAAWGESKIAAHLIPTAHYALARALWDGGGDRARARTLAEQARAAFTANGGPWKPKADEVAAWLTTHR